MTNTFRQLMQIVKNQMSILKNFVLPFWEAAEGFFPAEQTLTRVRMRNGGFKELEHFILLGEIGPFGVFNGVKNSANQISKTHPAAKWLRQTADAKRKASTHLIQMSLLKF